MLGQARSLLQKVAADPANAPIWWRHSVRVSWVECEVALLESRYPDAVTYATTASTPRNLQMHPGMWPRACCSSRSRRSRLDSANRPFPISAVPDAQWFDGPAGSGMADPCRAGRAVERVATRERHIHFVAANAITDTVRQGLTGDLAQRWAERDDIPLRREAS